MTDIYTVRLEPVGVEFEVEEDETILDAAFRQGIALPHGCKEGQCSACKCVKLNGETEMLKYSTFALNDMEKDSGHILMCRAHAYSDIDIELLNYDEEVLSKSIPVKQYSGKIVDFQKLTHDIRAVQIELDAPLKFWAGQYVDITVKTEKGEKITRSFSMANPPSEAQKLGFIIKKYPDGRFSNELDDGGIKAGAEVEIEGPYGMCFRREGRDGPVILVGAGSGMSPVWSILNDQVVSGEERPIYFFYGARSQSDLFKLDEIKALTDAHPNVEFIPVLSHEADDSGWAGERGFVHECVDARLKEIDCDGEGDVYACGPPPMIDALTPVLFMRNFETDRIFYDKFTPTSGSSGH
ncbi:MULTISPECIES: 2Fe-2S iron-sulfur cluster binding domain-containing protein [Roseobacteraceae]|uniref:NADH:ubiquinone reductase (Na(+)-transporting) subunit F n=1 Tax=Roseobacteraceae TaxID=2854170 RepID=UPI00125F97D2|nr:MULTISPECIES: 2Fe-2S iron-sulfur cluster binding domain-containing protein [Roseobacteraceae]KAB6714966.1 CDP-6-deoxy-delta-3,4-glucoseen reductase [Roseobacter sp. TSBP12]|tara:strand:- start:19779 stop:20837 length:1059 start_codon:yes stop_codon:yes gene_type:complete